MTGGTAGGRRLWGRRVFGSVLSAPPEVHRASSTQGGPAGLPVSDLGKPAAFYDLTCRNSSHAWVSTFCTLHKQVPDCRVITFLQSFFFFFLFVCVFPHYLRRNLPRCKQEAPGAVVSFLERKVCSRPYCIKGKREMRGSWRKAPCKGQF